MLSAKPVPMYHQHNIAVRKQAHKWAKQHLCHQNSCLAQHGCLAAATDERRWYVTHQWVRQQLGLCRLGMWPASTLIQQALAWTGFADLQEPETCKKQARPAHPGVQCTHAYTETWVRCYKSMAVAGQRRYSKQTNDATNHSFKSAGSSFMTWWQPNLLARLHCHPTQQQTPRAPKVARRSAVNTSTTTSTCTVRQGTPKGATHASRRPGQAL